MTAKPKPGSRARTLSNTVCLAALLLAGSVATAQAPAQTTAQPSASVGPWNDSEEMDAYIDDLMARMTLEEKIGQMTLFTSGWDVTGPTLRDDTRENIKVGKVGALFNAYTVDYNQELQELAVNETRLGIPLLFGYDVIHGHRTIFPISLGEAATWDLEALEKSARISAVEAAAEGIHWTFAPMIDVARDPRWGRMSEGAGEDVYLTSEIARVKVRGYQGDDLSATDTILATAKHFAAYGAAQAGRDYHTTDMSDRELRETYLPPFKAAVEAGVATIMTAFNEVDGVPASGSEYLLTDILRDEWGFDGFVVTDYTSINEMVPHGYSRDLAHSGEQAANAGVDMDMQGGVFMENLHDSVKAGRVSEARIDKATRRILEMKYRLGLFEDPFRYFDKAREKADIYKSEHLDAARDVARRSMVLLKNDGRTLPLSKSVGSIALIGPLADSKEDMIGSWAAAGDRKTRPVTVLEGLREKFGDGTTIRYAKGASYEFDAAPDPAAIDAAVAIARQSDVIVVAVGEKWNMTGEAASRTSLTFPGHQQALLDALSALNKPIVMVLMSGRPMALEWADANMDAILKAWYPGTMGGHAVADILVGDYNPSGKLPVTFPRNVGQVPIFYNMKNTGRPYTADKLGQKYLSRYLVTPNAPLYPFGYGLSYTEFSYSPIVLQSATKRMDGNVLTTEFPLTASVTLTNTGPYDGTEIVQFYMRDHVGSTTRPVRQLKGFEKVELAQGESKTVSFTLDEDDVAFYGADKVFGAEAGDFSVMIGGSSDTEASLRFTVPKVSTGR